MEVPMTNRDPDRSWREHVLNSLPRMEANDIGAATSFAPATDFGPVVFRGDRSPDDAAALLPDASATKSIAIRQIASDLHVSIPKHEQLQELRLEITVLKNRLADLKRPLSEGGSAVPATAFQIEDVERQLQRAEKELARLTELKEVRTVRWNAAGQLDRNVGDWVLRGIPGGVTLDAVADAPLSELMTKADGGRIETAVERWQLRLREFDAAAHRVRSQLWPISMGEADARELVARRAEAGRPSLENAIEHGLPITFATMTLRGQVHNAQPGAVAFIEAEDAVGLFCYVFGKELLEKISADFREISDGDKDALDERQREEMLATIASDRLAAERAECALIWHAAARGEVIDFRAETTPMAAIGVSLRTLPRATELPPSSQERSGFNLIGGKR
jgi:hypothetical protein